jgi:hypothetical protein
VTPATAVRAAKCKLQAKRHYFFSFLCDNAVNIFDKYVLSISLKRWSHGENARRNTSKYYGYLCMSEREGYGQSIFSCALF